MPFTNYDTLKKSLFCKRWLKPFVRKVVLIIKLHTLIFVEQSYHPFLVSLVKALQPDIQSFVDVLLSFLKLGRRPCQVGSSE